MLRRLPTLLIILVSIGTLLAALGAGGLQAALDSDPSNARPSIVELLVVEAEGCSYCPILRRDVEPVYLASPSAQRAKMRFADINVVEGSALVLDSPIYIVPTVLVLQDGKETGRLSGYLGVEDFMRGVSHLLGRIP
jgi:hypothetical protein